MTPAEELLTYVVGLNCYALLLIYLRSWLYRVPVYRPMVKNFWLSVLPLFVLVLVFAGIAVADVAATRAVAIVVGIVGLGIWLLALPNSSYLITELNLNHRRDEDPVPLWYDIIAVLSFAMSGVINMVVAVLVVQMGFVVAVFGDTDSGAMRGAPARSLSVVIILLVSIGIYLGRYLRLNSWDVKSPRRMWAKVRDHFDSRAAIGGFVLFCLTHTVFLLLVYGLIVGPLMAALVEATAD
ncbi:DUF1361 domain-containing protein [Nocardia mexicana]|uniref:Putative membrane protein n=1 Tax=Nocardia mexicana TaxID=279262 RepID=A0A370GEX4_9NOCA|nr:DUF1361 domain-containing protein [Nocardia mexicana]RDI42365.1 putative membrane protein [Nocardia mexicana]